MSNVPSQTRERLRLLAMILALVIGGLLIAQLWTQPLSQTSLTTAGRGVLALGLMGTRRLSVVLTALLCSVSLTDLLSVDHTLHISDALEVMTLLLCAGLLLVSARASLPQDTVP